MLVIIVERRDTLVGTVGHHEVNRTNKGVICVGKGDISAATVLPIQIARITTVEGVGVGVVDFEVEVVAPEVRVEGEARVEEALVALIHHRTKGQVQCKKRIKRIRHQKVLLQRKQNALNSRISNKPHHCMYAQIFL